MPTPVNLGISYYNGGTGSITTSGAGGTTTADAPAGTLVVVCLSTFDSSSITSIVDSAGNTYSQDVAGTFSGSGAQSFIWSCLTTFDLPIGGAFTINGTYGFGIYMPAVISVSGAVGGLDQTASAVSVNAGSFSLATSTLSNANEIMVGSFLGSGHNMSSYVEGSGFTNIWNGNDGAVAYQVVSSTAAVTWAPSWTGGEDYSAVIATFIIPSGLTLAPQSMVLM